MSGVSPYEFINSMFDAQIAKSGGIVRRSKKTFEKNKISLQFLVEAVKKKNFHLIESGDQYIVVCNSGIFKVHV